jgi:hypothetical protein
MSEIGLAWPFSTSFAQENDKDGLAACARTATSLGTGRPLSAYLADLERQIGAHGVNPDPQESSDP